MRAVAFRFPDELIDRTRAAAHISGMSVTAYVRAALEARLDAPPLTSQPMVDPGTCPHKWRNPSGKCFACGDQR